MIAPSTEGPKLDLLAARPLAQFAESALAKGLQAAALGRVTAQIPAISAISAEHFGLAVALIDGTEVTAGDALVPFSAQSITKLFALCALLRHEPTIWARVGWDPSDAGYGSVIELELHDGRPRNPFVNAGALVVTDRLLLNGGAVHQVAELITSLSGLPAVSDRKVAESEGHSDHRNRAIAHVLADHGRLVNPVDKVLDEYFAQCAITTSALALARSSVFLAARDGSRGPLDGGTAKRVNAVLLTAGMYGAAGDIAYRIGLPAKSGIGGGVLAIMPGVGTICVWSPPLDAAGNSVGGVVAIEEFARAAGWSVF